MRKSLALKLLFIITLINTLFYIKVSGQAFMPFAQSNYAGVSGILYQPASIADSRYKFDMAIFGVEASFDNNYLSIKRETLMKGKNLDTDNFFEDYVIRNIGGGNASLYTGASLILPSFMVNLGKRSSMAFTTRVRAIANIDNITEDLLQLASEGFDYEPLLHKRLTNANLSLQINGWLESGFSFASVILNREKHFLKGGATVKMLQGVASGYMFMEDLNYRLDSPDTLSLFQSKVNYGISNTIGEDGIPNIRGISNPSFGFDLGLVYEYRPHIAKYTYSMDGQEGLQRDDKNKYLFRLGVSLIDFGQIKYNKGYYSQDFVADIRNWDLSGLKVQSLEEFNDTLRNRFNFSNHTSETFSMGLPTTLSFQADFNLGSGFYVNFTPYIALKQGTGIVSKTHYFNSYSFTPRFDSKWFGVAVPLSYDQFKRFNAGISFRLGPVWIGSNSLVRNGMANEIYGFDVYTMIKFGIFKKTARDRDNDAISDKLDQCPEIAGIWALRGCPDTDGDGIQDDQDLCPYDKGLMELSGCPDGDGDGIPDGSDQCPKDPGLPQYSGCPDSDSDGVVDHLDECPDQAGLPEYNGCPDRDLDGIPDRFDECADVPGKPEFNGCPFADTDKDGISDQEDDCPQIYGPKQFMGCPDTDGDGISDKYDLCHTLKGVPENNGCPPIEKKEQEILDRAFSNLEFETGKSIIKAVSYPSLIELSLLMIQKPEWKVQLSGHTDNTGNPEKNMELSKNRTQAVKDYLIKQGVQEFRIRTEWFGQERPVADNATPAGRQKNRRVEMKIVFD